MTAHHCCKLMFPLQCLCRRFPEAILNIFQFCNFWVLHLLWMFSLPSMLETGTSLNIHMDSKTPEGVTSCPSWHRPKRSGYTSNASHFWKMPLAAASSQEAAECSQAQPVRCGRGFRPNHIRVQYLDSGSVFDTHGENGQGKCREKGKHGKLDCFVLYCIKRLLFRKVKWESWHFKLNSWLCVFPMFCEWTGQSVNCYQVANNKAWLWIW